MHAFHHGPVLKEHAHPVRPRPHDGNGTGHRSLLGLQRTVGNTALAGLLGRSAPARATMTVQRTRIGEQLTPGGFDQALLGRILARYGVEDTPENRQNLVTLALSPHIVLTGIRDLDFIMRGYLRDNPAEAASCFPTARDLFPLLSGQATPHGDARAAASHTAAAGAAANRAHPDDHHHPDKASIIADADALAAHIEAAAAAETPMVYRLEVSSHGTTLVLRRPAPGAPMHVEQIETIGGQTVDTARLLHTSLAWPALPVATASRTLRGLVAPRFTDRERAFGVFRWNAEGFDMRGVRGRKPADADGRYYPWLRLRWWANPLADNGVATWRADATTRLESLDPGAPAPAQEEPQQTRKRSRLQYQPG